MIIIAIDCGASFIKAARLKDDFITIEKQVSYRTEETLPLVDKADESLPQQLRNTISAVKNSILALTGAQDEVYLGLCNEMHGFVLTDSNLMPLTDYVSWQKEYTTELYNQHETWQEFLQGNVAKEDIENTGMPFKPGLPSTNMAYLLQNHCIMPAGKMFFFTLGDFILSWLAGEVCEIHPTNAAASGLYDLTKKDWNHTLIHDLKLENVRFPKVCKPKTSTEAPLLTFEWQGRKFKAAVAIGDQQAALLGAGLCRNGQLSVNMGTGAQVSVLSELRAELEQGAFQIRPYFGNHYLLTVPHIPSGRALNVFFRFIKEIADEFCGEGHVLDDDVWKWLNLEAETVMARARAEVGTRAEAKAKADEEALQIDLSFFSNAVTDQTVGSVQNISEKSFTVGNFFSSVYRQMAANVYQCVRRICGDTDLIDEVIFSGGVVRKNAMLREEILSYFNPAEVCVAHNETLVGIAQYIRENGNLVG